MLTSFHMPLFFFLSGLFLLRNDEAFLPFVKKKARTLLFPCLTFGIFLCTYSTLVDYLRHDNTIPYGLRYVGLFINMRHNPFPGSLWFFPCLFLVEMLVYALIRLSKNRFVMLANAMFLAACGLTIHHIYGKGLPWSIDIALYCTVFTMVGMLVRKKIWSVRVKVATSLLIALLFVPTVYANYSFLGDTIDLYSNRLGCYPLFYLAAFCGIYLTVCTSKIFTSSRLLVFCGRNSMIIYALQFLFLRAVNKVLEILVVNGLLRQLTATVVVMLLLIPAVNIVNNRFRWMTGDFRYLKHN